MISSASMYNTYFGLSDSPFSIAPNPQFLYMSERHREALAHLLYGIKSDGGFVVLTGEVGTGKTTVCRCLLEQIPDDVAIAFILNPKLTAIELLATICEDLSIEYPPGASIKTLVDRLNDFLLASYRRGRRTVLIIDEAQNLSVDVLEQLRLLTNLETNQSKLLQIILLGQPELLDILDRREMRQLAQRVTARFHLDALNRDEVAAYIGHRLEVAGGRGGLFPPRVMQRINKLSGGVPRLINLICDRSLLGAYAQDRPQVDTKIVDRAAAEIFGRHTPSVTARTFPAVAAVALLVIAAGTAWYAWQTPWTADAPATAAAPQSGPPATAEAVPATGELAAEAEPEPIITARTTPLSKPVTDSLLMVEGDETFDAAMARLFQVWGAPAPNPAESSCQQAPQFGLECLSVLGSLRELRHLDRPAVVKLTIAGLDHHLVIRSMENETVELVSSNGRYLLTEDDVLYSWDGRFSLLWKMPPGYRLVRRGDSGTAVDWLWRQLALVDGEPAATSTVRFDEDLERRLKRFQISVGLRPDGIAGERTWIHLNSATGTDVPHLARATGDA